MATTETAPRVVPRRAHPQTEYWDVRTASWRTATAIPAPRKGA